MGVCVLHKQRGATAKNTVAELGCHPLSPSHPELLTFRNGQEEEATAEGRREIWLAVSRGASVLPFHRRCPPPPFLRTEVESCGSYYSSLVPDLR